MPRLRSFEKVLTFEAEVEYPGFQVSWVHIELGKWLDSSEYTVEDCIVKKCWISGSNNWMKCLQKKGNVFFKGKRFSVKLENGAIWFDGDETVLLEDVQSVCAKYRRPEFFLYGMNTVRRLTVTVPQWWLRRYLKHDTVQFMQEVVKVNVLVYRDHRGVLYDVVSTFGDLNAMGISLRCASRKPKLRRSARIATPSGGSVFYGGVRRSARLAEKEA